MELLGSARFAKLHSEIMNVVRGSVDQACYAGIRTNKKKHVRSLRANCVKDLDMPKCDRTSDVFGRMVGCTT